MKIKKIINLLSKPYSFIFRIFRERSKTYSLIILYKIISFFLKSNKFRKYISLKLSTKKQSTLEITGQIGCTMMCTYCPQTLIVSEAREKNIDKILELENFEKILENVPINTKISWAGYTEPLLHSNFKDFVKLANKKGYVQTINTTMHGKLISQEFMSNTSVFESVGFHLPDNEGLMKLNVKESYLLNLEKAIRHQAKVLGREQIDIKIIGKKPHINLEKLLNKLLSEDILNNSQIHSSLQISSRNDYVDQKNDGFSFFSYFKKNIEKESNSNPLYYCSYQRLNSNVLIPNGEVNICCNDYSLGFSLGNLLNEKLDELQKHKKLMTETDFLNGNMTVCNKCEYYKSI